MPPYEYIDERLDEEWNQYVDLLSKNTNNRFSVKRTIRGSQNIVDVEYDNWKQVKKSNHNFLSKIPFVDGIYLYSQQKKQLKKDNEMAIKLSQLYGKDADFLYNWGSKGTHRTMNNASTDLNVSLGFNIFVTALTIGTSAFYLKKSVTSILENRMANSTRKAQLLGRTIKEDTYASRRGLSALFGRRSANVLQGAAAETEGLGSGVELSTTSTMDGVDENTHLLAGHQNQGKVRQRSFLQQFRGGYLNKGVPSSSSSSTASIEMGKVQQRASIGWVRKQRERFGCDTGINFVEMYKARFGNPPPQRLDYDKAWKFITDREEKGGLGFETLGHTDHPKLWHPKFQEPPPKVTKVECAAQFENRHIKNGKAVPVDMIRWIRDNQELFGNDVVR
jgi:hypothetical protein